MTPDQRTAALRLADELDQTLPAEKGGYLCGEAAALLRELAYIDPTDPGHEVGVLREHVRHLERRVRELAREPVEPAPGYCKHCKQYTIEEPLPAEPYGLNEEAT